MESDRRKFAEFKDLLPKFEGAEAIYSEGSIYALVRIKDIRADAEGLEANVVVVQDLASTGPLQPSWKISASWEIFSFDADRWDAAYVSYHIRLNAALVQQVKARAKELPGLPALSRRDKLDVMIYEIEHKPRPPRTQ